MADRQEQLFAEIYRDFRGVIAKTTNAFAQEQGDRDDLFQEILLSLWQAIPKFNEQAKLSTYVYRIALSRALNWKRSRLRYRKKLKLYECALPEPSTATSSQGNEQLRWLYARIHELAPVDRSLILLSLDRVSYAEIAEIAGLSESNVGVRLHRIKQQLARRSEESKNEI